MTFDLYLAFVLATILLILFPGPAVTLIVANSLTYGARRALVTVAGSSSAIAVLLVITTLGMTSLIAIMADWFEWLRWAGVAYLIYLGVKQWRAPAVALDDVKASDVSGQRLFWQGFIVNATNPKTLVFYAAFFPQFIVPASPALPQLILLSATFLVIATALDGGYALIAGRARAFLRTRRQARLRNRITGSLLITAGLGLALARRN